MTDNRTGHFGFTLVEVLVALAVFSIMILTLFSSFNAFTASSRIIRNHHSGIEEKGIGLKTVISDIEQIFILQPPQFKKAEAISSDEKTAFEFIGLRDTINGVSVSTLSFASLTPVRPSGTNTGITRVTYYVYDNDGRIDLHRSDRPAVPYTQEAEPDPCVDPILFKNILGFDLVYIDRDGKEWDTWNSMDEEYGHALPAQLDITITIERDGKNKEIKTMIPLSVNRTIT